ncbi:MAG TPA: type II toxin-antitoxin system PemK/MazF family toxin, partial [Thermoanaerobaculia bacterium]|nr:type II toxin-antitoxin system PemK/MazF family toxin [Thermoanaerobaculia bacterium]
VEIKKWRAYLADLNPRIGTEPGKVRPVVVVQTDLLNGVHPSTVICPVTTNVQPGAKRLRVHLETGEAGLDRRSDILVDQIRAIDNRRLIRELGDLSQESRRTLTKNIEVLLT